MLTYLKIRTGLHAFLRNEDGATAIEYGLIAGLISIAIVASATLIGPQLAGVFGKISAGLPAA